MASSSDSESAAPVQQPLKPAAVGVASPPVLVYKTRKDYSDLVPVGFRDKKIISYPHPRDLKVGGQLVLPTPLADGYWLDNRGISENTAFLRYTYEEYAALPDPPADLYQSLLDTDPLLELWNCGPRNSYSNPASELNSLVKSGNLESRCVRIK